MHGTTYLFQLLSRSGTKDRCYVRPRCDSSSRIDPARTRRICTLVLVVEKRKGERKKERTIFDNSSPPFLLAISREYTAICPTHSYCAIELMAKEKSERKPTDELDLWWKLVARRSKENNLWIERNGCNVFFRSGRRLLYVKLIPRSGERFSIQGYSR